ncbi:glycosyltransferase [Gaetbulibacter sp. M235]|uniref:glycosyltransferase n=1 Tax=Gaetbulibacter sp. M235 TaxID=3126510 RepID=UPI00374F81AD
MNDKKRILVAPLNWGLGHATRCIPIINALMGQNFEPIIASDGAALNLLKKEFPTLIHLELPTYHISYSKYKFFLKWQLFKKLPKLIKAINEEKREVQNIIKIYDIKGIISDNRFGVYSTKKGIPSVYITHQLRVYSGTTTWLTTKIHQKIINKHDECWIPDFENNSNLSGKLGHIESHKLNLKYIGVLSRFSKNNSISLENDILVVLSGLEPQRSVLEEKILKEFENYKGHIILVRGVVESTQTKIKNKNLTIYNFMKSLELEKAILSSHLIISRSGYTTIMDLTILEKKVFFIPTPGQNEQEYLAKRLEKLNIAPYCKQSEFTIEKLEKIENYNGFLSLEKETDFETLFSLFKRE